VAGRRGRRPVNAPARLSNFRDVRNAHKRLSKIIGHQSTMLLAAADREQRIRDAAVLALHEGLPEGPGRALLDLARKRTELSLLDALGLVSEVFHDE
jgi:hypothetical protein